MKMDDPDVEIQGKGAGGEGEKGEDQTHTLSLLQRQDTLPPLLHLPLMQRVFEESDDPKQTDDPEDKEPNDGNYDDVSLKSFIFMFMLHVYMCVV